MSNIPRKSLLPTSQTSIPRRSSSADIKWASANATSASGSQVTSSASGAAGGRQSMIDGRQSISSSNLTGRASSVGCSGRQSLMGRPSMSGKQPGEQRSNSEMAYMISSVKKIIIFHKIIAINVMFFKLQRLFNFWRVRRCIVLKICVSLIQALFIQYLK